MITDAIYARAVMDGGLLDSDEEGTVAVIPFMVVQVFDSNGTKKTVYCNYAFGTWSGSEVDFYSPLGKLKMLQLGALRSANIGADVGVICQVLRRSRNNLVSDIIETLQSVKNFERVLFVWDKVLSDECPFYRALNINLKDLNNLAQPILLASEGLTFDPDSPFMEVSLGSAMLVKKPSG